MWAHREMAMWGHNGKAATHKPQKEVSGETNPTDTLILGFQSPELCKYELLLVKAPSLWWQPKLINIA